MGHRLSKIVTKTGDAGTTGLGDGSRVTKDSARISAIGDVDELNSTLGVLLVEELPPLKEFILPGGSVQAAHAHVGRTVCRRAERALVHLAGDAPVSDAARRYLNRLSDLLFVLARALNRANGRSDVLWQQGRARGAG